MTQTNEGTGSGAANRFLPPIYNGVVKATNLSDNLLNNLMRLKSVNDWVVTADDTITEVSPTNEIFNGDDDDEFISTEIGFPIKFAGIEYTSVFIVSNSYITFGAGHDSYSLSTYEEWANLAPGLFIGADDNSYQVVLTNATVGEVGSRTTTIRFQGTHDTSEDPDFPIVWEVTFYEAEPERISLNVLSYTPNGDIEGVDFFSLICDGNGNYRKFASADLPKLHFDGERVTSTGESIDFTDSFVSVTKNDMGGFLVDTSSYRGMPQLDIDNDDHTLSMNDAGKHIYCGDCTVTVPYHDDVPLPIGTKITIVTKDNGITINKSGVTTEVYAGGSDNASYSINSRSVVHLLKVDNEVWHLYGENINT